MQPEHGTYRKDTDTNLVSLIDGSSKFGQRKDESHTTETETSSHSHVVKSEGDGEDHIELGRQEVVRIPDQCPNCFAPGETLTALTDIPHFKEVNPRLST